ncbi:MAG: SAM-dependent methyltransferase [Tannerellaceae bacterium]|jgi:hypothetical protein|nr:SAM-dependent methyltransferase [Tannerellaceae bacterium]
MAIPCRKQPSCSESTSTSDSAITSFQAFVQEHADDDTAKLLLAAGRFQGTDVPLAVEQIIARRHIREKLPSWYADIRLLFPSAMAAEQASSEFTAAYKQKLILPTDSVCDLTGGLGVDSIALARKARRLVYVEQRPDYCRAARHNFNCLNIAIDIIEGKAEDVINLIHGTDIFYIDPARRKTNDARRLFAITDCEPNLIQLLPLLWERAPKIIAKLSPMADISRTLALLPNTREVHILSVRNECKELIFVMERQQNESLPPDIHCINRTSNGHIESFIFNRQEEADAQPAIATMPGKYICEPNSSVLKAGAFKTLARHGMEKLHVNSHLYTTNVAPGNFPGRIFIADDVLPFNNMLCKTLRHRIPKANIAVRNFPIDATELRRRTRISDGGETYIFATTLSTGNKVLIPCRKATD